MSTPIDGTTYPFDPTGQLASNLIPAEMQILTAQNFRDYHFLVPNLAPYFTDSLVITYKDTSGNVRTLVEGADYVCTHVFHDASLACAKPIAGSISFYNTLLAGQVQLKYQTLGGIWTLDETAIAQILADRLHNPRITTWEQVTNQPVTFPVIDHEWNLVDLVGMSDVVTALGNIEDMLRQTGSTGLAQHLADHNNPHLVTAAQVGLGNVQNYGIASTTDAVNGTRTDVYMTPAATAAAIAVLPSNQLTAHLNDTTNPHKTTAAQVGLGNVQNYGIASTSDAQAGTRDDVYMTPLKVAAQLANGFGQNLANHEDDYTNPHRVTAHQAGAYTQAEIDAMLAGYVPSGGGGQAPDAAKVYGLTQPQLTAAILAGNAATATTAQTAANATLAYGLTQNQLTAAILTGNAATASNASAVYGLTQAQLASAILAGNAASASNAAMVYGMNQSQLTSAILAGTAANSQTLAGLTVQQLTTNILAGTAANASEIGGQTPAQFASSISTSVLAQVTNTLGTVTTQSIQDQDGVAGTWVWTQLVTVPINAAGASALPDATAFVQGCDSKNDTMSGLYLINLGTRGPSGSPVSLSVLNLNGSTVGAVFGWTIGENSTGDGQLATLWVKSHGTRNYFTTTELSQNSMTYAGANNAVTVEPSGITYATEDSYARESEVVAALSALTSAFQQMQAQLPSS